MRVLALACLAALLLAGAVRAEAQDWSWGNKDGAAPVSEAEEAAPSAPSGEGADSAAAAGSLPAELATDVIDDILNSGRQGRNLEGYDDVYADPNVQDALQAGNETSARHYIKDRLCSLGLSSVSGSIVHNQKTTKGKIEFFSEK